MLSTLWLFPRAAPAAAGVLLPDELALLVLACQVVDELDRESFRFRVVARPLRCEKMPGRTVENLQVRVSIEASSAPSTAGKAAPAAFRVEESSAASVAGSPGTLSSARRTARPSKDQGIETYPCPYAWFLLVFFLTMVLLVVLHRNPP